jgi:UDP-N-acetylmuramoylalanine--D-glutamate ligase
VSPAALDLGRVGVVGLGRSGVSAARLLAGVSGAVRVVEREDSPALVSVAGELAALGVTTALGSNDAALADWADLLVVSPGVPPSNPVIVRAIERGVPVWSEVELAWRLAPVPILAVTGTNGKTTTTSLLAAILQDAGLRAIAAGNIGYPLVDAVQSLDGDEGLAGAVIVCEVSSFQLAFAPTFRPAIALVLNVADDHYDWHAGYDDYLAAKAQIVAHQGPEDLVIANAADAGAMTIARGAPSRPAAFGLGPPVSVRASAEAGRPLVAVAGVEGGRVVVEGPRDPGGHAGIIDIDQIRLAGPHNLENVLAASLAALCWGVEAEVIGRAVAAFAPLPHRSTLIATFNEVRYVDDSKATNPHATLRALQGLDHVVLLAGGRAKGLDLSPVAGEADRLVGVIAMGEATAELAGLFSERVRFATAGSVEEAVGIAGGWAVPGDTVLLSPACSSLDQYSSYAERGERFSAAVRALAGSASGSSSRAEAS